MVQSVLGSLTLMMGHFFKNAVYSLILLGWEAGLPYLPSTLKFWTLSHYLQSLLPVRLAEQKNLFELMGEPASAAASMAPAIMAISKPPNSASTASGALSPPAAR